MNPQAASTEQRSPFSFSRGTAPASPDDSATIDDSPGAAPAASNRVESLIDTNATLEGHLRAEQDLRIQGSIVGEITCRGLLTIENNATARARIDAHDGDIHGLVEGDVTCSGRLRIGRTGVVTGTVKAGSLVVEEGASINGTVEANYSGEAGVTTSGRRRPTTTAATATEPSANGRKTTRGRDLPSFALVPADDSSAYEVEESAK